MTVAAVFLAFAFAAAVWFLTRESSTPVTVSVDSERIAPVTSTAQRPPLVRAVPNSESERDTPAVRTNDLVSHLRARYADTIDNPYTQMQVLDKLIRHYQKIDPDNWYARVLQTLDDAFPEHKTALAKRLDQRLEYQTWMEAERDRLHRLEPQQRQNTIWEARHRIFGSDIADAIWAGDIEQRAVANALQTIGTSVDTSIADKLQMYRQALDDVHDGDASGYLAANAQQAMDSFLDVASVQRDLSTMAPEERRQRLRDIRASMGLDAAALTRWEQLDRKRDERWALGKQYMKERAALQETYQGATLKAQLKGLRTRYFAAQADLIAQEEAAGLFRYNRPRRWGRN